MVKAKTQEASEKSFDNAQEKKGLGKYLPASIEKKWQEKWTEEGIYRFKLEKRKDNYYNLVELPYPSGDLHLGHWFTFVNADAHARHMKMSGKNVFYPNGFDAFGLPAENAAIKRNIHPQDWTMKNIETMKKQFATMGTMIDWAHEAITCLPEYYKWNQWIFIKMFERGIAYRGKTLSNWCPVDQTVLANEHVENGRCWRCGSVVEQKEVEQWFLKITEYAEELLWPDSGPAARVSHPTSSVASDLRGLDGALTRATRGIVDAFDNCIIVHGCPQSEADLIPKENRWMNWLEKELVARGGKAVALEMPKPWEPKYSEWKKALEKQNITKDTILIGHSCGAAFLIRWLLETKRKVKKLILVAPAKLPDPNGDKRIELYNFELPKKVAKVANETAIFISNDDQRHLDSARLYANALGARIVELKDKKHFVYRQTGFYEFPELLEEVLMQKKRENWGPGDVDWPKSVREGQNNWIGRSQGLIFTAPVKDSKLKIQTFSAHFEAFCADTFVVIAPDHPFLKKLIADVPNKKEILDFSERLIQERLKQEHTEGKTMEGIFTGRYIVDPVNGDDLPIWVASFALRDYGTGIVKCSAHDERDFAFAKKYGIKLHPVLFPKDPDLKKKVENLEVCYTDMVKGYLSEPEAFAGKKAGDVREDVINYVQEKGYAKPVTQYHLHDWSVSRQRYWGTPVPMIHCEKCGIVPVPLEDLPVELPYEVDYTPKGKPPLATADEWLRVKCPKCGGEAKRDAETLDTFFDSSWYYYRYTDPKYTKAPFNPELVKGLMPVDIYFGGAEHTLGHTLYARFFTKFFKDLGLIEFSEFAKKRIQHGVILGPDGYRMSKSRGNVVNPDDVVKEYGADTVRLYLAFMMPFEATAPWNPGAISGIYRFLRRVWELYEKVEIDLRHSGESGEAGRLQNQGDHSDSGQARLAEASAKRARMTKPNQNDELTSEDLYFMHKTIKKVGEDLRDIKFNTAVSTLMEWLNHLSRKDKVSLVEYETLLLLLAPFAPHMTEELWSKISTDLESADIRRSDQRKSSWSVHQQPWPQYQQQYLVEDVITIVVQVNGKVRENLRISNSEVRSQKFVEEKARESERVKGYLEGKTVKNVIYIPAKLLNFVTS